MGIMPHLDAEAKGQISAPAGKLTPFFRFIASHYTDISYPGSYFKTGRSQIKRRIG
jgi:hypothetical protein